MLGALRLAVNAARRCFARRVSAAQPIRGDGAAAHID